MHLLMCWNMSFCAAADVVLVLDNERLLVQLKQDLHEAHILPLPKSAGVSHFQIYTDFSMYAFYIRRLW